MEQVPGDMNGFLSSGDWFLLSLALLVPLIIILNKLLVLGSEVLEFLIPVDVPPGQLLISQTFEVDPRVGKHSGRVQVELGDALGFVILIQTIFSYFLLP